MRWIFILFLLTAKLATGQTPSFGWPPATGGVLGEKTPVGLSGLGMDQTLGNSEQFGQLRKIPELGQPLSQSHPYQGKFSHLTSNGDRIYTLAVDNMPCLVAKDEYRDDMVKWMIATTGQRPEPMPNALPQVDVIPKMPSSEHLSTNR